MTIDRALAAESYKDSTSRSGDKLARKYEATSGKLAKATSDAAQKSYVAAMQDPKVLERRRSKLRKLNEEDLNRAMREKGASNYVTGTASGAQKWISNTEPYLSTIESEVSKLPDRTRSVNENIDRRLKPIANALRAKKESMV